MKKFLDENFLLDSDMAQSLYNDHAKPMPIIDYHCHLPVKDIYENTQFQNITQLWLNGDHYKWRAMRANGIPENLITGDASDWEKFAAWAETVPATLGNPLYHWTHLELQRYFGIDSLLNAQSAKMIYDKTKQMLEQKEFGVRGLLEKMNVKIICTTDDPLASLNYHKLLQADSSFNIGVFPTFRPDKAMNLENVEEFNTWVDRLDQITNISIKSYTTYLEALKERHDYFHSCGCRLSDHGLERPYATPYTQEDLDQAFLQLRSKSSLSPLQNEQLKTALMVEFGKMHSSKNWVMQLHFGAIRNTNSRMFSKLGPDTGYDSMGDFTIAKPLSLFLDLLDHTASLPKTIIYSINPKDNDVIATMLGNFQDGNLPGKMQLGSAWWFNDQRAGMERQLVSLANHGLLSKFVGMLTDSRSFLSYPRHEYFRRILCNMIGGGVEKGELPSDPDLLNRLVEDICFYNAKNYFQF